MRRCTLRPMAATLLVVVLMVLPGCAARHKTVHHGKPKHGIEEFGQMVRFSEKSVDEAMHALERVSAQSPTCRTGVTTALSKQVERLEVDSLQVRAHSQALLERGDAYFENWQERMAELPDPKVRALAQEHRQTLEASFGHIKQLCGQARAAFRPFLSGLRQLRANLEADPGTVGSGSTKDLVRATRAQGRQVQQYFAAIQQELDVMTRTLTPAKPRLL